MSNFGLQCAKLPFVQAPMVIPAVENWYFASLIATLLSVSNEI